VKQQLEEDQRVQELLTSRSAQQKLRRSLDAKTLQGRQLFKMLPDAFVFSYAGGDGTSVKLSFKPNPSFHPPSLEARVFHDMEGEMWIDCKQERLAGFDGHLTQTVKFGFGLLGHLDKGGHFEVRQAEVVPGHWDLTSLSLEMTGKALVFATIGAQKKENHRDFHRVSDDLTLVQARGDTQPAGSFGGCTLVHAARATATAFLPRFEGCLTSNEPSRRRNVLSR
jgi:hypothetical protein